MVCIGAVDAALRQGRGKSQCNAVGEECPHSRATHKVDFRLAILQHSAHNNRVRVGAAVRQEQASLSRSVLQGSDFFYLFIIIFYLFIFSFFFYLAESGFVSPLMNEGFGCGFPRLAIRSPHTGHLSRVDGMDVYIRLTGEKTISAHASRDAFSPHRRRDVCFTPV